MYAVKGRSEEFLFPIIKRSIAPGSVVYSDSANVYCNLNKSTSKFEIMGQNYFHFYTNHNGGEYIHPKFPFNSTMTLEH